MSDAKLPSILAYLLGQLLDAAKNAREPILLNQLVGLVDPIDLEFFLEEENCTEEEAQEKAREVEDMAQESALDDVVQCARLISDYRDGRKESLIAYFLHEIWAIETATRFGKPSGIVPSKRYQAETMMRLKMLRNFIEHLQKQSKGP